MKMRIAASGEKIFPSGIQCLYCSVISAHQGKHGIMQDHIMLAASLGKTDADDPMLQVNIPGKQHPCFPGTHTAAVQEAEKHGEYHHFTAFLHTFPSWLQSVAGPEKVFKLFFTDRVGQACAMLLSGNRGRDKRRLPTGIQVLDKINDDIYPGAVGIVCLFWETPAPSVDHFLHNAGGFRIVL